MDSIIERLNTITNQLSELNTNANNLVDKTDNEVDKIDIVVDKVDNLVTKGGRIEKLLFAILITALVILILTFLSNMFINYRKHEYISSLPRFPKIKNLFGG